MAESNIKIFHIDTEMGWRGGQQQAVYLHERLHKIPRFSSTLICKPGSTLEQECMAKKLSFCTFPMRNELDIISAFKIAKLIKDEKRTLIHCHSAHAQSIGILVKFFVWETKLISVRRVDFHIQKNLLSKWKYRTNLIDKIVCVSQKIKSILVEDGIDPNRMLVIHSGIDLTNNKEATAKNELREEFGLDRNEFIVGTVAAFVDHKDYDNFVEAAAKIIKDNPGVKFVAIGAGELFNRIKQKVKSLGITENFYFPGYRRNAKQLISSFDIFVLASKEEGLGTSVLDAHLHGLPVVTTNAGGIPEMIENRVNGIVVEKQDSEALAKAINELLSNKDFRIQLGRNAYKSVERFDIRITVDKYVKLYEELLVHGS